MPKQTSYTVIYRIGGTDRFQWRNTISDTLENTIQRMEELKRMGYHAFHVPSSNLRHGLPDTFLPSESSEDFTFKNGWYYRNR